MRVADEEGDGADEDASDEETCGHDGSTTDILTENEC